MNANELADALVNTDYTQLKAECATMLRQQQAEIEALKANREHDFGLGEASGFIKGHQVNPYQSITDTKIEPTVVSYTHPVELTDEEIIKTMVQFDVYSSDDHCLIDAGRAILRKAQEK